MPIQASAESKSCFQISGALNVHTVAQLREQSVTAFKTLPDTDLTFDLTAVTECDSVALALLTALTRDAKKLGKQIRFTHVPEQLMAIAQLSDVDKILAFSK
jgi:phospholipid transport system transporter-binding protein